MADAADPVDSGAGPGPGPELLAANSATVGGSTVVRHLPKRAHRTVGAWCFADHFGPADVTTDPMAVGPHPHIGLQTVTWLYSGEVRHTDSLGSDQLIRPGQLNLMTAGRGVAHAEQSPAGEVGDLHGMQLWVALPESTRWDAPAFEHHGELPVAEVGGARVTVMVGQLAGTATRSAARADTPNVGLDVELRGRAEIPLDPTFEHGVLVIEGPVVVNGRAVGPGTTAYLRPGDSSVTLDGDTRVMVLGGAPFESEILMSWNFVARTPAEMEDAYEAWAAVIADGGRGSSRASTRFGDVRSALAAIPAPSR